MKIVGFCEFFEQVRVIWKWVFGGKYYSYSKKIWSSKIIYEGWVKVVELFAEQEWNEIL